MNKLFYQSKQFWLCLVTILTSTGSLFTGEITADKLVPVIIINVLGILGIIFRWQNTDFQGGLRLK